ncbi:MHO_1580 family protein [Metamycoplasma spumans]|uniref:MHO_1580 family protein n=1 Tax=Metamycoplasma spumans TaxID=92406 RepID=UPI0034DCFC53
MHIVHNQKVSEYWLENFYIKAEREQYLLNWSNPNQHAKFSLRRLIKNDKFILEFQYANFHSQIEAIKVDGFINNKKVNLNVSKNEKNNHWVFSAVSELDKDINSVNFDSISNINFEIHYLVSGKWYQAERYVYYINAIKSNKQLKSDKNGIIINILSRLLIDSYPDFNNDKLMNHFENREYLSFVFKPNVLLEAKHNKKIYDFEIVKVSTDKKIRDAINQSDLENLDIKLKINTLNTVGDYEIIYNPWDDKKSILVSSYSFWNKKDKNVNVSAKDIEAKRGLLVPLNFLGNFFHEITISFGDKLKNFSVVYNQNFTKPFFSMSNGKIKLKTEKIAGFLNGDYQYIKVKNIQKIIANANSIEEINYWGGL